MTTEESVTLSDDSTAVVQADGPAQGCAPQTTATPYTADRIATDWGWYSHLLDDYAWFIDTHEGRVLHVDDHDQTPDDITLTVAPEVTYTSPTPALADDVEIASIGCISEFAGAIESGEILPISTGSTVALDEGLLSVTAESATFTPTEIPDGSPLLNKLHADVSTAPVRDRPDIDLTTSLSDGSVTYLNPAHATTVAERLGASSSATADGGVMNPASPAPTDPDRFDTVANPISKDTLKAGDACDLLKRVQTESVQLACFSPPYNIGKLYGEYTDDVPIQQWYSLMRGVFAEVFRALEPDGKVVVNIGKSFSESDKAGRFFFYPLAAYIKNIALDVGFDFWDEAIWQKHGFHNRGGGALMGSYPDPSNMMITQTHEHVLVFRKWVSESYFNTRELPEPGGQCRRESKLTKDRWRELTQSNWDIETVRQSDLDVDHSAVFPEELPKRAVQLYSFKGDTVLDPFVGTGTTAVAAKRAGRHYIGFDANEEYIEYAKTQVANATFDDPDYIDVRN